jgi:hypothetical protein
MVLTKITSKLVFYRDRVWLYVPGPSAVISIKVVEAMLAVALMASCLPLLWQFAVAMSQASLWQDELATVMLFSSKGAWTTVTNYTSGSNNHIFFNLVNALTPKADPYSPLSARMWSFVALACIFGLSAFYFFRQKLYLEAAILWALIATNYHLLDLLLQARGYGFAALAASVSCVAVVAYTRGARTGAMVAIGIATFLGTYSLPTYGAFGFSLIAALLAFSRDARWIFVGAGAAVGVLLVYLPVAEQMATTGASWASQWGTPYASLDSVRSTFSAYMLPFRSNGAFFTAASALLACAMILPRHLGGVVAARVFITASLMFLSAVLWLQTPTVRTTSFIVIPIGFACVMCGSIVLRARWGGMAVPLVGLVLAALLSGRALQVASTFEYVPYDNWKGAAELIQSRLEPGTAIWVNQRAPNLSVYLSPKYPLVAKFDIVLFQAGRLAIVDFALKESERFDFETLPPGTEVLEVRQRRNEKILLYHLPSMPCPDCR